MAFSGSTRTNDRSAVLLLRAEANLHQSRSLDAERLSIAREWALIHRTRYFEEPVDSKPLGAVAEEVYEYAPAELGVALELHSSAARRLMADAVDMHDRLPRVWASVQSLDLEAWVGRKIVRLTKELNDQAAAHVDSSIADVLDSLPIGRLLNLVEARVVEADTALANAKAEAARRRRFVSVGRDNEHGVRGFVARMDSAAAARLFATVDQIAQELAQSSGEADAEPIDLLRARALGMLADPAGAAAFLQGDNPGRGKSIVYVHATPDFLRSGSGVARVEASGTFPITRDMMIALLGHDHVAVKPVIDLADSVSSDSYEVPATISERLHLIKQADVFPYGECTSRTMDQDHTIAWPRGPTRPDNLGLMTRSHHRIKTHAPGWTVEQLPDHRYLWRTPHGKYLLTDGAGTHPIVEPVRTTRSRMEFYLAALAYEAA